jgi:DDE superfamily endonuclease
MLLWHHWWNLVRLLRPAFSRTRSFLWFATIVAGISIRSDHAGSTSLVRALGISPRFYQRFLDTFHTSAVKLDQLAKIWLQIVLSFVPTVLINGRVVLIGDGIKVGKEGRKMPAVKSLYQESGSNSKPSWIMGHSFQALGIIAGTANYFFSVPLIARLHEGIVRSNRDRRTLHDKFIAMLSILGLQTSAYILLDAYYSNQKIIGGLVQQGHHLISRMSKRSVAFFPAPQPEKRRRGRPRKYGDKVRFADLFKSATFTEAPSPVYGETGVNLLYYTTDLIWEPVGHLVRFVLVQHPSRGKCILVSTDMSLQAIDIIYAYGLRFKIEISFKQALHTLGTWSYHFWMKSMTPIRRGSGTQYLHRETQQYRNKVDEKIHAYHTHVQAGLIAQGLMQYLAIYFTKDVWASFGSWLRTIRADVLPSEQVVAKALRNQFFRFIDGYQNESEMAKFIAERQGQHSASDRNCATG